MGAFFVYILESGVCLAVFYILYKVLLSRETFHRLNRLTLLGLTVLSFLLPLVEIDTEQPVAVGEAVLTFEQWMVSEAAPSASAVSGLQVLILLYLLGIVCMVLSSLFAVLRMMRLMRGSRRVQAEAYLPTGKGIRLYVTEQDIAPFSWMRCVVMSEADLQENPLSVLRHECAHIRLRHSLDMCLAEICLCLQWFNPAAWLLVRELQDTHEYEADSSALRQGENAERYQLLLIRRSVGNLRFAMASRMYQGSLKQRISMMNREASNSWASMKYLLLLPVVLMAVLAFSSPAVKQVSQELKTTTMKDFIRRMKDFSMASIVPIDPFYEVVDEMPQYPGGVSGLLGYIQENQRRPQGSESMKGRVTVSFIVERDGSVTYPRVVRSSMPSEYDAEAVRLISSMPRWIPGRIDGRTVSVRYNVPVTFR